MQNTLRSLTISLLALTALATSAVAEPQSQSPSPLEVPVSTVVETVENRAEAPPQHPVLVQEDVEKPQKSETERPRGASRTTRDKQSRPTDKPLVEIQGF